MGFFGKAWEFVRRLPVARYIKPVWKKLLVEVVQSGGDHLQASLKARLLAEGPGKLDGLVDAWQDKMLARLSALPLPAGVEGKCAEWVRFEGDRLQARLGPAAVNSGAEGLDQVFDESQKVLRAKIEAL